MVSGEYIIFVFLEEIMIGAITGDIVGSRFEWHNHRSINFTLFDPKCKFTDDSVMSIAIGKAIMEFYRKGLKLDERGKKTLASLSVRYMREIGQPYRNCGYGGKFRVWMYSNVPKPYSSFGNGAAMRVSGAAWAASTLEEALELAKVVTAVTHDHPEGIRGAQAATAAIFMARQGKSKDEIRQYIHYCYYRLNFTIDELRPTYKFNASCMGSVPQAIEAFLESSDFENAIRLAVSLGGDSDTIAAITGSIAEAFYGVPPEIEKKAISYLDSNLAKLYQEWKAFQASRAPYLVK